MFVIILLNKSVNMRIVLVLKLQSLKMTYMTFFRICLDSEELFLTVARGIPALFTRSPGIRYSFSRAAQYIFIYIIQRPQ